MRKILFLSAVLLALASCNSANNSCGNGRGDQKSDALSVIMSRKSVRQFADTSVSDGAIDTMLKAAMAAPSGRNLQPWHFVVLRDTSRYDQLFADNFNMGIFKQASAVVLLCADTTFTAPTRDNPDGPAVVQPNNLWRDDMGACAENFLLACEALGYGACWTAVYPYQDRQAPIREGLHLPAHIVPYCAIPVGVPAGNDQPKDKWKPERVHHENF